MSDPARYTDGSTDDLSEDLDVIADALAAPGASTRFLRNCRDCGGSFWSDTDQVGSKWLELCPGCLRWET